MALISVTPLSQKRLVSWLGALERVLTKKYGLQQEIAIRFVSSSRMKQLNSTYRRKQKATDILSFAVQPYLRKHRKKATDEQSRTLGDIVLCKPVVRANARAWHMTFEYVLLHMTIHGVVHLMGHDHERDTDEKRMQRLEKRIQNDLFRVVPSLKM